MHVVVAQCMSPVSWGDMLGSVGGVIGAVAPCVCIAGGGCVGVVAPWRCVGAVSVSWCKVKR
jgi:hypothetical protein